MLPRVDFASKGSSYSCGRAKTEVFKYHVTVMPRFQTRSFEDADFFKYGEKESPFSKIPGYVWAIKYDKRLRVDADFLRYGEKISVSENPCYVWMEPNYKAKSVSRLNKLTI